MYALVISPRSEQFDLFSFENGVHLYAMEFCDVPGTFRNVFPPS
jgi:hypothetical protein